MDHKQAPRRARRVKHSSRTAHNQDTDSEVIWQANWEAFDEVNGVPSDALRNPPVVGGEEGNVIWVVVNDRQLAVFDAL